MCDGADGGAGGPGPYPQELGRPFAAISGRKAAGPFPGGPGAFAATYQTTKSGKRYAVGYITNAIEGGHRTGGPRPGPKAAGYRYQPRLRVSAVPGLWFYDTVRRQADSLTQEELDELLGTIIDGLEGRL